jgi:hypothetical protein
MRINKKALTLIIASLCGNGSSTVALGQHTSVLPASSVGRIGDSGTADRGPAGQGTTDWRPSAFKENVVSPDSSMEPRSVGPQGTYYDPSSRLVGYNSPSYAPNDMSYSTSEMDMSSAGCGSGSCGSGSCGSGSCGTASCGSCGSGSGGNASSGWLETESILWWGKGVQGVPLVVGGNSPSVTPTTVLAGGLGQPIGGNLLAGMRVNVGVWLDDCENFGVGARGWGIFTGAQTTSYNNGGNSTAVPFFNTSTGLPSLYNVNEAQTGLGANTGTIQLKNDLNLIAGELYGRSLLARTGGSRVDLLTGYTFIRLDSELGLGTSITDGITGNLIPNGTVSTTQDTFSTKNQFHGGHIGLSHELTKGRFTFTALGKVALGNMEQSSSVSGNFAINGPVSSSSGNRGLFAQSSNRGVLKRNQFTFVPEAGAKIKYQLGQAQFGVGYTLLVLPSVAMAASQIDPNIDFNGALSNTTILTPAPKFTTDTVFLHGIDLGLTFQF